VGLGAKRVRGPGRNGSGVFNPAQNSSPAPVTGPAAAELEVFVHQNTAGELPTALILKPVAKHQRHQL